MEGLPHDRSHSLCDTKEVPHPTKLFQDSIRRWLTAHLSDDSATDGNTGSIVQAVVVSKSTGVFCGRIPVDLLFAEWFPSCDLKYSPRPKLLFHHNTRMTLVNYISLDHLVSLLHAPTQFRRGTSTSLSLSCVKWQIKASLLSGTVTLSPF